MLCKSLNAILFPKFRKMPPKKRKSTMTKTIININMKSRNPDLKPFPHPFIEGSYGNGSKPKSQLEINLMSLSASIRSKPNWFQKMKDETIRNKWKREAVEQSSLNEKQVDYVLAELEYYDKIRENSIEMSTVDGVWQSDSLISNELKKSLIECVKILEDIPESERDWHPDTNNLVLNLVHPSLFCLVYGETRVINSKDKTITLANTLNHNGDGEIIYSDSDNPHSDYTISNSYQWLPSEFNIKNDGRVKIESYINNLHPTEHKKLYEIIETIFEKFIPLFNKALTDLSNLEIKPSPVKIDPYKWYKDEESNNSDSNEEDDYSEDPFEKREFIPPDVEEFRMPLFDNLNKIDLKGKNLQVIVKLANILLTPEKSSYPGGSWHVEGMKNEHIVASGIYYYQSSNITQSNLQFRTAIAEPDYEQNDERGVSTVYGLNDEMPLNQRIGEIITQEDRCIVFPNIYQHCVAPFSLQDVTKPGQRKILVFFLVDPALRIISTENVPPQQSDWYKSENESKSRLRNHVKMTLNKAKEHRESLMKERKFFISQNNEYYYERPFSLCEH